MRIEKARISGPQFLFTIVCFLQASSFLTLFVVDVARQDSWIVILSGIVCFLPVLWLYRTLMVRFPDKNLLQVFEEVYGRAVGKVLGLLYVWYFITLTSLNLADLGSITESAVMERTSMVVLLVMCVIVSSWAVWFGIRVVTRYSFLFSSLAVLILTASVLFLMSQMDLQNFLPMLDQPVMKYVQGTHVITTIPFGELVALLMITPNLQLSGKEISKYLFSGFLLGGIYFLITMVRDIAVLGNTMNLYSFPSLMAFRLINLGNALSRMEILFVIALVLLLFFKITFLQYVSVAAVAQLTETGSFRHLALAAGALMAAYGLTMHQPSEVQYAVTGPESTPIVWTFFEIFIPFLTYLLAKLRKLPKTDGKKPATKGKRCRT